MAAFRTSRTFDVFFLIAVAAIVGLSYANRTAIGDWMFFRSFQPSAEMSLVATDAGLSETGRHLLYRTNPQFVDQAEVDVQCDAERLGCLSPKGQAFILDDPAQPGQTAVTAAHEMLHLAYRRLSQSQKAELAPLLDQAIAAHAIDINDELRSATTQEERRDEAHSLLGTEYGQLPAGLETYYKAYFTDRSKVVALNAAD